MFIAKWDGDDTHDLIAHVLDVAAVVKLLIHDHLTKNSRATLLESFPGYSVEPVIQLVCFLAGLHDIGKGTPWFQARHQPTLQALVTMGYAFRGSNQPHAFLSQYLIPSILLQIWPEWRDSQKWLNRVGKLLGGHHGLFCASFTPPRRDLGDGKWDHTRLEIVRTIAQVLQIDSSVQPTIEYTSDRFNVTFAGLVTIADWIGSQQDFFPFVPIIDDPSSYWRTSQEQARHALDKMGWRTHRPVAVSNQLDRYFPDAKDPVWRPVQEIVKRALPDKPAASLIIVEDSTGGGKTEASWLAAETDWHRLEQAGLYIGMPTMATSNAMHKRLQEYLASSYPDEVVNLQLAHSLATLDNPSALTSVGDPEANNNHTHGTTTAESWFLPKKRTLFAPFGVGTVDQALMAVLQVKHFYLRLFALAGTTVIFDEIHAYDVYMSTLFDCLLRWLGELGVTVVLLSATLPSARRKQLIEAYCGQVDLKVPDTTDGEFPRVHVVNSDGIYLNTPGKAAVPSTPNRSVSVQVVYEEDEAILERLHNFLQDGGCGVWICNTVADAQKRYRDWQERYPDWLEEEMILFHARFPFGRRAEIEEQIQNLFGKNDTIRPTRTIVFATQVIEQSLDVDFDVMVSDLGPIDLLIQRIGRLQRHRHLQRPERFSDNPVCFVASPLLGKDGVPLWGNQAKIYDEFILLKTWRVLGLLDGHPVSLPTESDHLINFVYDTMIPSNLPDRLDQVFIAAKAKSDKAAEDDRTKAETIVIKEPRPVGRESIMDQASKNLDEDDPLIHESLRAATRLGPPSVTVICVHQVKQGIALDAKGSDLFDLNTDINHKLVQDLMRQSLNISCYNPARLTAVFEASVMPVGWKRHAALRYTVLLPLVDGQIQLGKEVFRLNDDEGLVITRQF